MVIVEGDDMETMFEIRCVCDVARDKAPSANRQVSVYNRQVSVYDRNRYACSCCCSTVVRDGHGGGVVILHFVHVFNFSFRGRRGLHISFVLSPL